MSSLSCRRLLFPWLSGFVDTLLFTVCPVLWTLPIQCSAKFHNIGISDNAILSVKDRLLLNITVFTLNFPISLQHKIPVLWNFQWRDFLIKRGKIALLPSVTAKTCRASFPVRAKRGEVLRQTPSRNILLLAAKRGENRSGACWVCP